MLVYNIHAICKARGVKNPYTFLVKSGISRRAAWRILNDESKSVRLKHIEIMCTVLNCEPNDLLVWISEKDVVYREDFVLKRLERKDLGDELLNALATMPLEKLKQVSDMVLKAPNLAP